MRGAQISDLLWYKAEASQEVESEERSDLSVNKQSA